MLKREVHKIMKHIMIRTIMIMALIPMVDQKVKDSFKQDSKSSIYFLIDQRVYLDSMPI